MKDYIYKYIYPRDLRLVIVISVVMAVLWVIFDHKIKRKYWKIINFVLLTISVLVILELTVFSRAHGQSTFYPIPFYSFRAAKQFPEFYRLNIMNGFLFVPFGLSLPVVIPDKVKYKAGAAVICGLLFSVTIVLVQLHFGLGRCETDDVIMNTLGTALGASAEYISAKLKRS